MLAERVKIWTEEWKQQGLQEGLERGREQGFERGFERGLERGLERGRHQGEATLLRRQLTRRFGPLPSWVDQRLDEASIAELESWGERVLDCTSLKDIFAGQG